MTTERRYAELHAHSAFTFLDGTDEPARMVEEAARLGLDALAILDVDGMYSTVQTTMAARTVGLPIVYGAELTLAPDALRSIIPGSSAPGWGLAPGAEDPGMRLPIVAASPTGYAHLVGAMSDRALSEPGQRNPRHDLVNLSEAGGELVVLTGGRRGPLMRALRAGGAAPARRVLDGLVDAFGRDQVLVEWQAARGDEDEVGDVLAELARASGTRLVATSGARMSSPSKQALGDILTATRLGSSLDEAEAHLSAHRSFLRSPAEMARLHGAHPQALDNACEVASACAFDLRLVAPRLPRTQVPDGHTPDSWLAHCTYEGASVRYGSRAHHPRAWETIEHELGVIERLGFAGYFLIVKEIVDFCARNGILCQGRGSAANSAVCYCLGITAVDAVRHNLLFERFLSDARSGPPDIDVDIEACRREEVIQYVYDTFGRDRAAQVANVITYRPRSAIRDVARALGYPAGTATAWSQGRGAVPPLVRDAAQALARLPRHMGIHSGGMVLTDQPVSRICPVGWAAMPGRTVLQWDKEDCADAGLVKFDLLSLGMLTALRVAFEELQAGGARAGAALNQLRGWAPRVVQGREGQPLGLHTLPEEDPRVYDLLCAADTVGVFQVESRAQMNTLPRLKPRCFYDIVVEVALIRPGPIQGRLSERRSQVSQEVSDARRALDRLSAELSEATASAHQGQIAAEQTRLRVEDLQRRALEELSLDPEQLLAEFGPETLVPMLPLDPDDVEKAAAAEPSEYVRAEQERALAKAQKDLEKLGRVNPLALEEHEALASRHKFLVDQVQDLKQSKADLLRIVTDVDRLVEEAFASAFAQTREQFEHVFGVLFPGGAGHLVLTDPEDMLATGIEIEARPAGKKVKRLSLLSGGERSLAAIAFLVAIFKARPSPFYVMDEVEAALDDVNLSRLLVIFKELQETSQLIVITHQKRTMEIADALYGVTMRDGVTTVVSQRLAD